MRPSEKPEADRASTWSDKLMAPGDGLRQWWDRLSRVQKWGFGVIGFGLLALLPLFPPPFLNTPNISFGGTMAQFAMVAIIAIGLNVVVGQTGLLDLGYVGFYAVGAYTVALLDQSEQPVEPDGRIGVAPRGLGVAGVRAAGNGDHRTDRAHSGHADAAATRRLPGHRHAGVRRDHPVAGRQPRRRHQRSPRPQRGGLSPLRGEREAARRRVLERELDGRRQLRHVVVLAGHHPDRHHPAAGRQPGTQPRRARLGRHPRGRGRRGSDGRQHVPLQVVGVRDRCGDRWTVRGALRRPGAVRRAPDVQHHQLDAVSLCCRARRPGQQTGRGLRCVHHRLSAEPTAGRGVPRYQPR